MAWRYRNNLIAITLTCDRFIDAYREIRSGLANVGFVVDANFFCVQFGIESFGKLER